jgi:hypothetical protein
METEDVGGEADDSVLQPWSDAELARLAELVQLHGPGSWAEKANLLGSGRTTASVGAAWRRFAEKQHLQELQQWQHGWHIAPPRS